jgi:hypothetical protein
VVAILDRAAVPHALIGAAALAAHGVSRATADEDLLALGESPLTFDFWAPLRDAGVEVEVRRGDPDDPLAGVVRFRAPAERSVDLVLGKFAWQRRIVERARRLSRGGVEIPVVGPADLILLKLFAGGPQDAWDIHLLLAGEDGEIVAAEVERHLPELPANCDRFWRKISSGP